MLKQYIDYETRKTLHVSIMKATHGELRTILFRRGLSLQEVFDMIASKICDNEPAICKLLDDLEHAKKLKMIKRVSETDSTSLYRLIEEENPLKQSGILDDKK